MEIKNKLINTKEYKNNLKLNKKMKRKALKYKTKDINECTPLEQSLFFGHNSKDRTTKLEKHKFLQYNKHIILLYTFPKSEAEFISSCLTKLFYENPMKQNIFSTIIDNDYITRIKNFNNYENSQSFGNIGHIHPKKIDKYVDYIQMTIFNFSKNYFGIAFECSLNENILTELNSLLICDIEDCSEYKKYYIGNKKQIGKTEWNPDIIRRKKLKNTIIEIKCRINEFLNSYLKFEKHITKVPISINILESNYDIVNRSPHFMMSHDIYGYTENHKFENFSVWERSENKSDSSFKTDICFDCSQSFEDIDRSSNIFIYTKDCKKELFFISESLINIYVLTIYFYKLCELEELITKERNDIFAIYNKKKHNKIYSSYNNFSKEILKIMTSLSNVSYGNSCYINEYIKNSMAFQKKRYQEFICEIEEFKEFFSNKLSIENISETRKVSYISLLIAFLSLLIALIPIIYNNSKEKEIIENISNNTSYIENIEKDIKNIEIEMKNIKDNIINNNK